MLKIILTFFIIFSTTLVSYAQNNSVPEFGKITSGSINFNKQPISDEKANSKPNIVIILIDDMGYADPSCFGNKVIKTPNIDALAHHGIKFTNFYVNSPICSPSRVAINTGSYPMRFRIHSYLDGSQENKRRAMSNYLNPDAPFLARVLKENGYATGHFGKWHMGGGRDLGEVPYPSDYGYDKSLVNFEGIGDRVLFTKGGGSKQSAELERGNIVWAEKHKSTGIFVDSALTFIEQNHNKPFFINLCPNDVHDPHWPSDELLSKFKSASNNPFEQRFFAVLSELDFQIGRFIKGLNRMGLLENTVIVFTSDNGPIDSPSYYNRESYPEGYKGDLYPPGFTGTFYGRKWSLFEGGIRMPFIISWPGKIPENKTDSITVLAAMDLFPSICRMLGIEYPKDIDGKDKSVALLGNPLKLNQPIMWEYSSNPGGSIQPGKVEHISPNLAIREGDWKLLINTDSTGVMLFNLKNDPGETNNLVKKKSKKAQSMAAEVLAWRRSMPVEIPQ
jgi:arylsulfatase A-like enzyme